MGARRERRRARQGSSPVTGLLFPRARPRGGGRPGSAPPQGAAARGSAPPARRRGARGGAAGGALALSPRVKFIALSGSSRCRVASSIARGHRRPPLGQRERGARRRARLSRRGGGGFPVLRLGNERPGVTAPEMRRLRQGGSGRAAGRGPGRRKGEGFGSRRCPSRGGGGRGRPPRLGGSGTAAPASPPGRGVGEDPAPSPFLQPPRGTSRLLQVLKPLAVARGNFLSLGFTFFAVSAEDVNFGCSLSYSLELPCNFAFL